MSDQYRYGQWVQSIVDKAPPLTPEQRDRIASLFRSAAVPEPEYEYADPDLAELRELGHE